MRNRKNTASHARHHINLRLERWHRWCLYASFAWLTITGVIYLIAHFFLRITSQFGESVNPIEPWSMRLHGAGAMVALFFLGSLMNSHIRRAIKSGRNLNSGWTMIVALSILIASGYGLYYIASEGSRPIWSNIHWILGLILPAVFTLHIIIGRKSTSHRNPEYSSSMQK